MPKPPTPSGSNRASAFGRWELVVVGDLRPAARLTRTHPGWKRRALEADIREFGILDPLTINADNVIVDGNLRHEIATALGLPTVPVIRIEHLSDAELRAHAIAANKLPAVANFDLDALRIEFEEIRAELPKFEIVRTGFSIGEVDRITGHHLAGLYDDLDGPDEPVPEGPSIAQRGDLYQLGNHRLICGDSLDAAVLSRLMGPDPARCCFTDPPYNVKVNGHISSSGMHPEFAVASGELSVDEFTAFLAAALSNLAGHLSDGAIAFVCMDHAHLPELLEAGGAVFDDRLNVCVWDKGQGGQGALYRSQHELIVVFKKGRAPHLNNVALGKHGRYRTNIWSFPGMGGFGKGRKKARELHPTVKPVALVAEALLDVTAPGDVVLDPFGGSGSTLVAAERINRHARLVEFEPRYVDRTIARWERMTGAKAELVVEAPPNNPDHETPDRGIGDG